jgi:hypothetical protein
MYEISILQNVITFIYGAIDDLYQKAHVFHYFFSIRSIR